MRDIIKDSALVLAEKIRCGEIKIVEVLDAVYESEKQNKELNCFITLCRELAYSKGSEIQKRIDAGEYISPLAGVPIGIKDNIAVKDVKMTGGSRMLENYVPPVSAAAVESSKKRGLLSSASSTWTSSPWARRARLRITARCSIPLTKRACPAVRLRARRRQSRRG